MTVSATLGCGTPWPGTVYPRMRPSTGKAFYVPVDVSGVLKPGDRYEVRNFQALFGAPVASGVYHGGTIDIPMTGVTPPASIGRVTRTPPKTGPAFDVFLLTSPSR
jgi:hypothetical protein